MGIDSWRTASRRVWGWQDYLSEPHEVEATALRDAARRVIDGVSPYTIAREWRDARLPTALGGTWTGMTVGRVLQRRTNEQGSTPLLDHDNYKAVVAALTTPKVRRPSLSRVPVGVGRWIVTAIAVCGICGAPARCRGTLRTGEPALGCGRDRRGAAGDGERHPTAPLLAAEAVVHRMCVNRMASTNNISNAEAIAEFDAMTLRERREVASRTVSALIEPSPRKAVGHLAVAFRSTD